MKKLIRTYFKTKVLLSIILFLLLFYNKNINGEENRIIFKINDKAFTSLDLEMRIKYLDFVGNNQELDEKIILEDFISANIFYEYYNNLRNKENYDLKVKEIYEKINIINKENNKELSFNIDETFILYNIKLDLIRKSILEKILNENLSNIDTLSEEIDLLYNFKIKYINIENKNINNIKTEIYDLEDISFNNVKKLLNSLMLDFFVKEDEIYSIKKINKKIRENILSNRNFLIREKNNKLSLIFIEKKFETLTGVTAHLYSVGSVDELSKNDLKCSNLISNNNNFKITNKEYKFSNLNKDLKNNLINIGDYVKFKNNNENIYVILCNIKFDKEHLNDFNLNKIVNTNVSDIEKEFILKYSKIFNFIENDV